MAPEADSHLAARVLPVPLYRALRHVFSQGVSRCALAGGTALAGYYAGHRRSDALDLFAADESSQRAAVLAVRSLAALGAALQERQSSAQFHSSTCELGGHGFTTQVVLDPHLFAVGGFCRAADGVLVAELPTLLKMKAATLVSRCAEKDLYDLLWLLRREPGLTLDRLVALGAQIDGGMSAEAVLASVVGTTLRRSACGFSLSEGADAVFRKVSSLKRKLARGFERIALGEPVPPIGELIRRLRPPRKA